MPPKKMVITQNLLFNVPLAFIMNLVSTLTNPNGKFDFTFILMFLIGLALVELLGAVIPIQKISGAVGNKIAPGKDPMMFPQFFVVDMVVTVIITVLMTAGMTFFGLLFAGQLSQFPRAYVTALPVMLVTSYVCVLVFMPLSMKVSGLGRFIAEHQGK